MKTIIINTIALLFTLLLGSCSTTPKENEIDRLVAKYATQKTYQMPSTLGTVNADVIITNNSDNFPFKIALTGNTTNPDALSEIVSNLILEKIRTGYKTMGDSENYSIPYIRASLKNMEHIFKKDSMLFAVFSKYKMDISGDSVKISFNFSIINTDERRRFGNALKIDF